MKSGHQGGMDLINQPGLSGIAIGVEGKRYGQGTKLSVDALKYKIFEAAAGDTAIDLWVLATTREVKGTDLRELTKAGQRHGISVAVIDSALDRGEPSSLATLCAASPGAVQRHFNGDPPIDAYLAALRSDRSIGGGLIACWSHSATRSRL